MKTIIVTRHKGAAEWLRQAGHVPADGDVEVLAHLDEDTITGLAEGDSVIGVLPISLAARLNDMGVRTFVLTLNIPADLRGKELSAEDMDNLGARVDEAVVMIGDGLSIAREMAERNYSALDFPSPIHPLI